MHAIRPLVLLLLVAAWLPLTGCRKGPTGKAMQAEVQAKLDAKFGPGIFSIESFERNGSFPYSEKDDPTPRLLVYFKARLRFLQDYGLGEAGKLNAAVLATVLGARPGGITGVVPEGNRAEDVLKIFGSASYVQDGEGWTTSRKVAPKTEKSGKALLAASENRAVTERWLDELKEEFKSLSNQGKRGHLQAFEHETWKFRRAVHLRLDSLEGRISLLTGGNGSEYTAIGKSLARVAKARKLAFRDYNSAGSVHNCRIVGEGQADFGITQNDIAYMARRGEELFEGLRPYTDLQAVCGLYPEALQIVTLAESGIESVRDLAGRKVTIGSRGSGTRVNAVEVLEAHGIDLEDLEIQERLSYTGGLRALREGRVEVLFMTTAFPSRPLEELANDRSLRLLSLDAEVVDRLVTERPFLRRLTIPKGTYHEVEEDIATLGVTAMVVTHSEVPPERIEAMLALLFDSYAELEGTKTASPQKPLRALEHFAEGSSMASFISRVRASQGISIPFHPAAARNLLGEGDGGTETGGSEPPSPVPVPGPEPGTASGTASETGSAPETGAPQGAEAPSPVGTGTVPTPPAP